MSLRLVGALTVAEISASVLRSSITQIAELVGRGFDDFFDR